MDREDESLRLREAMQALKLGDQVHISRRIDVEEIRPARSNERKTRPFGSVVRFHLKNGPLRKQTRDISQTYHKEYWKRREEEA